MSAAGAASTGIVLGAGAGLARAIVGHGNGAW